MLTHNDIAVLADIENTGDTVVASLRLKSGHEYASFTGTLKRRTHEQVCADHWQITGIGSKNFGAVATFEDAVLSRVNGWLVVEITT